MKPFLTPILSTILCIAFVPRANAQHEGKIQILLPGTGATEGSIPRRIKPAGPHLERVIEQLLAAEGDLPPAHAIDSGRYNRARKIYLAKLIRERQ